MKLVSDKDKSDSDFGRPTDTEYVKSFMSDVVPYSAGKWTDVFGTECSAKSSSPVYPLQATSRGAPTVH